MAIAGLGIFTKSFWMKGGKIPLNLGLFSKKRKIKIQQQSEKEISQEWG